MLVDSIDDDLTVTAHLNIHVLQNISSVLYLTGALRSNSTLIGGTGCYCCYPWSRKRK